MESSYFQQFRFILIGALLSLFWSDVAKAGASVIQTSSDGKPAVFSTPTTSGNTIVCYTSASGLGGVLTDDAAGGSNTYVNAINGTGEACSVVMYYSLNAKPATTIVDSDGSANEVGCTEFSGIYGWDTGAFLNGLSNTSNPGPVTASAAGDIAVIKTCSYGTTSTPTGYTLLDSTGGDGTYYTTVTSAGSFSGTVVADNNPDVSVMGLFTTLAPAPTLVQLYGGGSGSDTYSALPGVVTFSSPTVSGHTIICYANYAASDTLTVTDDKSGTSNNYTIVSYTDPGNMSAAVAYSIGAGSAQHVTLNVTGGGGWLESSCSEWSGIKSFDKYVGGVTATTTLTMGPMSLAVPNEVVIFKMNTPAAGVNPIDPSYTYLDNFYTDWAWYATPSAAGPYSMTASFTGTSSPNTVAIMAAFIPGNVSPASGCTSPAGSAGQINYNSGTFVLNYCDGAYWNGMGQSTVSSCTVAQAGRFIYTGGIGGIYEFCNGTNWISMKGATTSTCTSSNQGQLIWDSGLGIMKYCDGNNYYSTQGLNTAQYLSITSEALYTQVCSTVTVQSNNAAGVATNPVSDLTVSLAVTGPATIYTDSTCTTTGGTSNYLWSYNNNTVFYVKATGAGSVTLTATTSGYLTGSLTATAATTSPFTWHGGGGNVNWSTAGNWSGGVVPGSYDIAIFDNTCSSNCSPTIDTTVNVGGIVMTSGYAGTITQGTGNQLNINGMMGYLQSGGTFNGSNAEIFIGNGSFQLLGGSFKSTSGLLLNYFFGSPTFTMAPAATWNANGGSVELHANHFNYGTGSPVFNNLNIVSDSGLTLVGTGTPTVNGTLTLDSPNANSVTGGTILAKGNINISNKGLVGDYGSAANGTIIKVGGSASQTITATGSTANLPSLQIASTGGTVTLVGNIIITNNYTYTSGTLSPGTSSLVFSNNYNGSIGQTMVLGTGTYYNVTIQASGGSGVLVNSTGNATIASLTIDATNGPTELDITSGTLTVKGAVNATATGGLPALYLKSGGSFVANNTVANTSVFPGWMTCDSGAGGFTFSSTGTVTASFTESYGMTTGNCTVAFAFANTASHSFAVNLTGNNYFGSLSATSTGTTAATLSFGAGTTSTQNSTLTLSGVSAGHLLLRSTTAGTQWNLSPSAANTVGPYLDVKDSRNTGGFVLHSGANYTNSGNNTSWSFP